MPKLGALRSHVPTGFPFLRQRGNNEYITFFEQFMSRYQG